MNLEAAKETNTPIPWATILKYEYQIRKRAMDLVKDEGKGLRTALKLAMADTELRNMHFINRITLGSGGRKRTAPGDDTYKGRWQVKGDTSGKGAWKSSKAKGKGKGNGKKGGKGKSNSAVWKGNLQVVAKTPDELPICFAFNWQGCDGSCGMFHCCRVMGCCDKHPMYEHEGWTGGPPPGLKK